MLTISPGSSCDVCAEEYGPHCQPHSIPCGHILCARCCSTIVEKTPVRLAPACPFCREHFSSDSIRLIRMDYSGSGWSTPRRKGGTIEANIHHDLTSDLLAKHTERLLSFDDGGDKTRAEARRLESKVAKVAAKKCSVEEVTTLHKELQEWLTSDVKPDDQTSSLFLSAALLRAILMNHIAHSEASKLAKSIEANLKGKLDHLEATNNQLEAELRKERAQREIKAQECQHLRTELSQLKALTSTLGFPSPITSPEPTSPSPSPLPSMSSTSSMTHTTHSNTNTISTTSTPYSPTSPTHVARFNSIHARSASVSSRPTTPSSIPRSHTPSPHGHPRSHTPGPSSSASAAARSHTPSPRAPPGGPSMRSYTPSIRTSTPAMHGYTHSHSMSHAHSTSSASHYRSQTPAGPPPSQGPGQASLQSQQILPSRPRRVSLSAASPQKMMRSMSDEKHDAHHERWYPVADPDSPSAPAPARPASAFAPMRSMVSNAARSMSSAAAAAARYRGTRSPSPHHN